MDLAITRALAALRNLTDRADKITDAKASLAVQHIPRCTQVTIATPGDPLVNGTANAKTVTASWTVPVVGDYRVVLQTVVAAARVGTIHASIVAGTKTATTVDITAMNLGASSLMAGSLDVVIHPD